jgi:retron-type reverse transcriptase
MKRHGHLWEQVIRFEALLRAADKARKGKRFRPAVASFHFDQERELWKLHKELSTKTYRPGAYRSFFIYEPKKRQISAAPYRDRVVHHALVNVLEPIYERTFIPDSYACRRGKGTHAAVDRCQQFTDPSGNRYALLQNDRPDAMERAFADPTNPNALRG